MNMQDILKRLGIHTENGGVFIGNQQVGSGEEVSSISPVDGKVIAKFTCGSPQELDHAIVASQNAQKEWQDIPAPLRGEVVRQFGNALRDKKEDLGALVSYEMGKSYQEGLGEVQEMIDICDFAVGQSRMLYGMTTHSERPNHRMFEQWHPFGVVGIISAFNFPVAVWCWNTALAWIAGNACVWKPSEKSSLCAIACQNIWIEVAKANNAPAALSCVVSGRADIGQQLCEDERIPLVSATGSTRMGKAVARTVGSRLGKSLLELGGNNAVIISQHADLKMVIPATVFGAVGTCGQRCTSTRRLIIHNSIYNQVKEALVSAYGQLRIGDPLDENNHVGPLTDTDAVQMYQDALQAVRDQGGKFLVEGGVLGGSGYESGCYVKPAIAEANNNMQIVQNETFAPILYIMSYNTLEEAIDIQNGVAQGLSSAIMTDSVRESELFLSAKGSDCGIANVNIGTSGAEIGGAFGGEKETGGGRESGSDAWKAYMRRQTNTINYGSTLPLAQGIKFDI